MDTTSSVGVTSSGDERPKRVRVKSETAPSEITDATLKKKRGSTQDAAKKILLDWFEQNLNVSVLHNHCQSILVFHESCGGSI